MRAGRSGAGALAAACLALALAAPAFASQLFTTGAPNHAGARLGDRNTAFFDLAQSFTLSEGGTSVTDLHWWGLCGSLDGEPLLTSCTGADSFDVAILGDAGGLPGGVVASLLSAGDANRTATGALVAGLYVEYAYSIDFAPIDLLPATRYWLAISNAPSSGHWFWEETNPSPGYPSAFRSADTGGGWAPLASPETPVVTFAMTVTGNQGIPVPEPGSLALVAAALAGFGALAAWPRRRPSRGTARVGGFQPVADRP